MEDKSKPTAGEQEVIKTYEVPGFGKIKLMHNKGATPPFSSYNAQIRNYLGACRHLSCKEDDCQHDYEVFGGYSTSEEQLKFKVGLLVEESLDAKKSRLEEQLEPVISSLSHINVAPVKMALLDAFEVKEEKKE